MIISIPEKVTIEQSEKYILSIRLRSGGLSFFLYSPISGDGIFYREVEFDQSVPYADSLKEFFFVNEFLSWTYKRIFLVNASLFYTIVPTVFYEENQKEVLLNYNFLSAPETVLANSLTSIDSYNVFGLESDLYEFCSRSLIHPEFIHHVTPLIKFCTEQSKLYEEKQMYIFIHAKTVDILCFSGNKLLFINSFGYLQPTDIVYYILYIWTQNGMDQLLDKVRISGNTEVKEKVIQLLSTYLKYVGSVEIPSDGYLLGGDILQMPLDMIALLICEL